MWDALHAAWGSDEGGDSDEELSALHAAVRDGHVEGVNDLLENGESISSKGGERGYSPLHVAVHEGSADMVELLLLKGANKDAFDDEKWTPLYLGAHFGRVAAVLALLAAGADVNVRCGALKRSVVHMAAQEGEVGILRAVVGHGANVNVADTNKNTPLHAAATANVTSESIDVLAEAGANLEAKDLGGCTPLHNAAIQFSLEGLRALLKHGASIDDVNLQIRTPLVFAASHAGTPRAVEMVDFLLKSGADETIVDEQGRAAVDVVGWLTENYDDDVFERDVNRVGQLLANAPADRAWRRRGYLVLCRAHLDRVQHHARAVRRAGGDWASVAAWLLEVKEDGLFRTIVEYL